MPATGLRRTAIMNRVLELIELDPEFADVEIDSGPPHTVWQEASRYIQLARVTGEIDNLRFGRPNPTWDDNANVEIWVQGFASSSMDASQIAEDTTTMVIRSISSNRQLSLNDDRLDGVSTSRFTELDGPMFLGTDQGVIASFRMILLVQTLVRTVDE